MLADQTSLPRPDEFPHKNSTRRRGAGAIALARMQRRRWLLDRNGHHTGAHHAQRAGGAH